MTPEYASLHEWLRLHAEHVWQPAAKSEIKCCGSIETGAARIAMGIAKLVEQRTNNVPDIDRSTAGMILADITAVSEAANCFLGGDLKKTDEAAIAFGIPLALALGASLGRSRAYIPVGDPAHV